MPLLGRGILPNKRGWVLVVLTFGNLCILRELRPLRIDHHGVQLLFALIGLVTLRFYLLQPHWRWRALTGLIAACGLAVGGVGVHEERIDPFVGSPQYIYSDEHIARGPGLMSFAALDAGAAGVTAADRSKPALELARALAQEATEPIATREWSPERPLPDGQFDLILMGHVVNELFGGADAVSKRTALLETVLAKLKPRGTLLILEPALRDTSRALLQVRDAPPPGDE